MFQLMLQTEALADNAKFTGTLGDPQHPDPTSSFLDVVFELPEMSPVRESVSSSDGIVTSSGFSDFIAEKQKPSLAIGNHVLSKSSQSLENVRFIGDF